MASSAAAHMDGWSWMTAAFRAVLPVAHARFHEVADQAGARGDPDVFGLPQGERIHGSGRPGPARIAVAIPHRLWRSVHFDFDSSAEAVPLMCRHVRFRLVVHCSVVICNAASRRHYRLYSSHVIGVSCSLRPSGSLLGQVAARVSAVLSATL